MFSLAKPFGIALEDATDQLTPSSRHSLAFDGLLGTPRSSPNVIADRRRAPTRCLTTFAEPLCHGAHRLVGQLALTLGQVHEFALPRIGRLRSLAGRIGGVTLADACAGLWLRLIGSGRRARAVLLLGLFLLTLSQAFEQLLLLLGRHPFEHFTRALPEILCLLLLTLRAVGTIGEFTQSIGKPLWFAGLLLALLSTGLFTLLAILLLSLGGLLLVRIFASSGRRSRLITLGRFALFITWLLLFLAFRAARLVTGSLLGSRLVSSGLLLLRLAGLLLARLFLAL